MARDAEPTDRWDAAAWGDYWRALGARNPKLAEICAALLAATRINGLRGSPERGLGDSVLLAQISVFADTMKFYARRMDLRVGAMPWTAVFSPDERAATIRDDHLAALDRLTAQAPWLAEAHYARGAALAAAGDRVRAARCFEMVLRLKPHPGARPHAYLDANANFELADLDSPGDEKAGKHARAASALLGSFGKDQPKLAARLLSRANVRAGLAAYGASYSYSHRYPAQFVPPDLSVNYPARFLALGAARRAEDSGPSRALVIVDGRLGLLPDGIDVAALRDDKMDGGRDLPLWLRATVGVSQRLAILLAGGNPAFAGALARATLDPVDACELRFDPGGGA